MENNSDFERYKRKEVEKNNRILEEEIEQLKKEVAELKEEFNTTKNKSEKQE